MAAIKFNYNSCQICMEKVWRNHIFHTSTHPIIKKKALTPSEPFLDGALRSLQSKAKAKTRACQTSTSFLFQRSGKIYSLCLKKNMSIISPEIFTRK
jgi:hypothetical protein